MLAQLLPECPNRSAINGDRLDKPALLLTGMVQLRHQLEVLAHLLHCGGECTNGFQHRHALQVTQHVMSIVDGFDVVQRCVEERREVVLLAPRNERCDNLVEVQIGKEVRLSGRRVQKTVVFAVEHNAVKCRRRGEPVVVR